MAIKSINRYKFDRILKRVDNVKIVEELYSQSYYRRILYTSHGSYLYWRDMRPCKDGFYRVYYFRRPLSEVFSFGGSS